MNTKPLTHHIALSAQKAPALRWDGKTVFSQWRENCYEKLSELLGMNEFVPCEPVFRIESDETLNSNRYIHFLIQTEEGYFAHCHLLLPMDQDGPLPLCCCLQGHSTGAHISLGLAKYPGDENTIRGGDRDFAVRAVKEGYAALAVEQRAFGECGGTEKGPACERAVMTAMHLGRTVVGERIWDVSRAVDAVLLHFGDLVTMSGSVLVGNSGGGTVTYYAACIERRFDGYMPSCAVCTYHDSIVSLHHCSCNYIPGIGKYFDMGDLAGMIAPKKLVVVCGKDDPIFPLHGVEKTYEIISELYSAAGTPDFCRLVIGNGAHRFYADDGWKAMKELLGRA